MGLLTMLLNQGSPFTAAPNGSTPPINPLATQQSQLHADGNLPGYSLDGSDFPTVNSAYQQYNDGTPNFLPQPSQLDVNGQVPTYPLSDPSYGSMNNSFQNGTYVGNFPG
jgi:hypothetical protein